MRLVETTHDGSAVVAMDAAELVAVMNVMNEALNLVAEAEFHSRIGVHRADLLALWESFDQARARLTT